MTLLPQTEFVVAIFKKLLVQAEKKKQKRNIEIVLDKTKVQEMRVNLL